MTRRYNTTLSSDAVAVAALLGQNGLTPQHQMPPMGSSCTSSLRTGDTDREACLFAAAGACLLPAEQVCALCFLLVLRVQRQLV